MAAWIAYESDRIVHVPSNTEITMEAYKVAWDSESNAVIIHKAEDKVYDRKRKDDRRKLAELAEDNYVHGNIQNMLRGRYFVEVRRMTFKMEDADVDRLYGHGQKVGQREFAFAFDNLTDYFAITFSRKNWRSDITRRGLLFVSTDRQAFENAKEALQSGLGAIRFDELNGKPSDCKGEIREAFWHDVLGNL